MSTTMTLSSSSLFFFFFLIVSTISVTSTLRNLSPATTNKGVWCVASENATDKMLQANIDWCCSLEGGNCSSIQPGGVCFEPNTVRAHASFAMNLYFQNLGGTEAQCDFGGTGTQIYSDPSFGHCVYVSY